jgi:hypothetical protein
MTTQTNSSFFLLYQSVLIYHLTRALHHQHLTRVFPEPAEAQTTTLRCCRAEATACSWYSRKFITTQKRTLFSSFCVNKTITQKILFLKKLKYNYLKKSFKTNKRIFNFLFYFNLIKNEFYCGFNPTKKITRVKHQSISFITAKSNEYK